MPQLPLLVFSDLDGTLLDHDTYSWAAAKPALAALHEIGAGLVLASSKTGPEIRIIQDDLGITDWPAIVENGAGVLGDETPNLHIYDLIRMTLEKVPGREFYRGFGDMSVAEITNLTGLPAQDAKRAKTRTFSEPGLWSGPNADRIIFLDHLKSKGITAREGGRFLTLSMGQTKADQMAAIIARFRPAKTLALGDAPNDIEMLQTADHGVIVANPHRAPLPSIDGEAQGRITRTTAPGPMGWNHAVRDFISSLSP